MPGSAAYKAAWYQRNKERILADLRRKRKIDPSWRKLMRKRSKINRTRGFNRDKHRKATRTSYLKRLYGITPVQYDEMLMEQGGTCALCKNPPTRTRLHVDHDHETGKVRKL